MKKIVKKVEWLTCTPISFIGSARFFSRDSGLLSEGFKEQGISAQAIMLGPVRDDDDPRILRVSEKDLESADFWSSFDAKGVVFYGWAMPQYTPICKAIKSAGLNLVMNLDSAGLMSPRVHGLDCSKLLFRSAWRELGWFKGSIKALASYVRGMIPSLLDKSRLKHMEYADLIGAVSPVALGRLKKWAKYYGRKDIADRMKLIVHPIAPHMNYLDEKKKNQICVIGRWKKEDAVKQPALTLNIIADALKMRVNYSAQIIGDLDEEFKAMHSQIEQSVRDRIILNGRLANEVSADVIRETKISLCASVSESFHIASAEAMCCGCSVVSYASPYLPSFEYFITEDSGTLATAGTRESLSNTLVEEIDLWEKGERDPANISEIWSNRFHASKVIKQILRELEKI